MGHRRHNTQQRIFNGNRSNERGRSTERESAQNVTFHFISFHLHPFGPNLEKTKPNGFIVKVFRSNTVTAFTISPRQRECEQSNFVIKKHTE